MISAADEALRTAVVVRGSFAQWPQSPARLEEEEGGRMLTDAARVG
jgi:hypothetical protein